MFFLRSSSETISLLFSDCLGCYNINTFVADCNRYRCIFYQSLRIPLRPCLLTQPVAPRLDTLSGLGADGEDFNVGIAHSGELDDLIHVKIKIRQNIYLVYNKCIADLEYERILSGACHVLPERKGSLRFWLPRYRTLPGHTRLPTFSSTTRSRSSMPICSQTWWTIKKHMIQGIMSLSGCFDIDF